MHFFGVGDNFRRVVNNISNDKSHLQVKITVKKMAKKWQKYRFFHTWSPWVAAHWAFSNNNNESAVPEIVRMILSSSAEIFSQSKIQKLEKILNFSKINKQHQKRRWWF